MLAVLLTFAAEAAEEEPDQTVFHVLGALAALWAIVLFAVGMRSPSFPGSSRAMRGVIAISVVLVVGAMASSVLTA